MLASTLKIRTFAFQQMVFLFCWQAQKGFPRGKGWFVLVINALANAFAAKKHVFF
jgi:hypothetical protein